MFMSIFQRVFSKAASIHSNSNSNNSSTKIVRVRLTIYNAQQKQYPKTKEDWDLYDGIIITGSLSAAYEESKFDWIKLLMDQIQSNIHKYRRKSIGVCFGHQIYAHSFRREYVHDEGSGGSSSGNKETVEEKNGSERNGNISVGGGGLAEPCPKGMQVGIRTFHSQGLPIDCGFEVEEGKKKNKKNDITMLYTHGDMVKSIPSCCLSLGGTENVPIQACAYFASTKEKDAFRNSISSSSSSSSSSPSFSSTAVKEKPYAFTFQGHPEYASRDVGLKTYIDILSYLDSEEKLPHDVLEDAKKNALNNFEVVEQDCINLMYAVMSTLGWIE